MPEGPSIVILREEVARFSGKKILEASGTAPIDFGRLTGKRIVAFRSWGKHFLIELRDIAVRVHFLLFGTYLIDNRSDIAPKLRLRFRTGELNLYAGSVRLIEQPLDEIYDWSADVMSDRWDPKAARRKLRAAPDLLVCDALLDQQIFAGVGNIIKNEVLFRLRIHPLSTTGALPSRKLAALVDEARTYSFEFLEWKKAGVLKRHWQAHTKHACPRCDIPLIEAELGRTRRRTFFCERCQVRYGARQRQASMPRRPRRARRRGNP